MPQPTISDVHVNKPLTDVSIHFAQQKTAFIADRVFPNVPVPNQSDVYYIYNRGDFNRDEMTIRAPGTESEGSGYRVDGTPQYYAPIYAFHKDIPDPIRANSDTVLAPDMEATLFVTTKALIKRERTWASAYFGTGIWTGESAGTASAGSVDSTHALQWNDPASTPIEDIQKAKTNVRLNGGIGAPNVLTLGRQSYDALINHPDIIDRLKAGQTPNGPALANVERLKEIFEVDDVLIMDSVYNTAAEQGTESNAFIGGKHALLVYRASAPGLMTPSAGYTFSWTGWFGAGPGGFRIKTFRREKLESDRVEIQMAYVQKLISADLGYFFNGIVA